MDDDRDAVPGQLDIELPRVGTGLPGETCGLECILGHMERITPMSDDHRTGSLPFQERQESVVRRRRGRACGRETR